ncbi:MAG: NADP-dependent phosphogluconate dehydrogenase [Myxococcales bacterium]|nr:NADP-dependent phosphogluconate dehydrogenase [Myxococcales bacterium]
MALTPPAPASADLGLIGLAVMGQNLALNIADHGYRVAVFNRTTSVTERFIAGHPPEVFSTTGGALVPAAELKAFVASIKAPRRIVIMVKAGGPTDAVIDGLTPLLSKGDVIVDGGNALFTDTIRREKALGEKGLFFVGSGVSGGEEGARFGPSLMPGGKPEAWAHLEPVWKAIAAKVDATTGKPLSGAAPGRPVTGGVPCTTYIGADGAGHYVKMVHNGIEYADMELIAEAFDVLTRVLKKSVAEAAGIFTEWNEGDLDSFLIEITAEVLRHRDGATGRPFVEVVLDAAGQKGTGKWTSTSALDLGVPSPTIAEAVFQRYLSARKEERVAASKVLTSAPAPHRLEVTVAAVRDALYCSKLAAYAQGFQLMAAAAKEHGWKLDFGAIAQIFRGGCIIRARFLQKITLAYARDPALANLLLDPYFADAVAKAQANWRTVVAACALEGVPAPAFASALSYFDGYRAATLPANLIQAQRDFFGAHTFERVDAPRGKFFHVDWPDPKRPQTEA